MLYESILERRKVSTDRRKEMAEVCKRLSKKKMTKDGIERKEKAINKLFDQRKKTRMLLSIYMA